MRLRIVGGTLSGRRLETRSSKHTRPSSERVREGVFAALEARGALCDARVLDLFAGSGALGFEALSRGASHLLAADSDRRALQDIVDNARRLGVERQVQTLGLDLLKPPGQVAERLRQRARERFDLVLADPPYARAGALPALMIALIDTGLVGSGGLFVVEHGRQQPLAFDERLAPEANYRYGDTVVTVVHPGREENP